MDYARIGAVIVYILLLFGIAFFSYRKAQTSSDFLIGGRSLSFWLTALAAHASDMSSWLLMAFPATIYAFGMIQAWVAIGLFVFMFLNWQLVAPRIRTLTERYGALTFSSFFESRFHDSSGHVRIFTALMLLFFYTIYVSAGIIGMGYLMQILFGAPYHLGMTVGIFIIVPYLFFGGYVTLAWTDFFQGMFLMSVVIFVPLFVISSGQESLSTIKAAFHMKGLPLTLVPNPSFKTFLQIFYISCGWGLGYFGQPHIVTKFMGIKSVHEMKKAQVFGLSWMAITMGFTIFIAAIGIAYFNTLPNPEFVFIEMVAKLFPSFIAGFILSAIIAVTISAVDSQILVLATSLAEDFYKRIINKEATSRQVLFVSRLSIFLVALAAYMIAFFQLDTIFGLVSYAWSGLGSSFGPLILFGIYSRKTNKYGAWAGVLTGGMISAIWPLINRLLHTDIPSMLPGFAASCLAIYLTTRFTLHKHQVEFIK